MSQSTPGNTPSQANPQQASSQALLDELRVAADRAREERLKLARLVKHSAELPMNAEKTGQANVPDARILSVAAQIERLEQAVSDKLESLDQAQQNIDSRAEYLESLRHTITDTTRVFVSQVEQAQHFKAHIDAAKQHVRMSAGRVADDVREKLSSYEVPIAERLEELAEMDKKIDQRIARMQQMHKQANDAVDKHLLAALQSAKEQATDLAGPIKEEFEKFMAGQRDAIDAAVNEKIAELDVDVEVALKPLTTRFDAIVKEAEGQAELLIETLPERLGKAGDEHLEALRGELIERAKAIVDGVDEETIEQAGQIIHEKIAAELDAYLTKAEQESGGYVDGLVAKLDAAREQAIESFKRSTDEVSDACALDREQAIARMDAELERVQAMADERIAKAESVVEQSTDGVHARAVAAVDAAMRNANKKLDEYEAASVDHLRTIDDGIEHGIEQSRKRMVEHEKEARKNGEQAIRIVEDALSEANRRLAGFESGVSQRVVMASQSADEVAAQIDKRIEEKIAEAQRRLDGFEVNIGQRLTLANKSADEVTGQIDQRVEEKIAQAQRRLEGFEAGVAQRVSLANQTADDAVASVEQRLTGVEQDASQRIMRMVELAETSGNAVADSLEELAKSAERTAIRAQEDLDEKLRAFEHISAEALRTAEDTLRNNIGELRDSSRAMIEMVSRQVRAQAGEIEPQTKEVITQAEQTMRRRIGELRDAAQSMVDITVSRLASQLEEVKSDAQKTAFQGIQSPAEPEQGSEAA